MQKEITKKGKLLNESGNLANPGYSKTLIQEYHKQDIKTAKIKLKEWDYYLIINDDFAVALTVDDNSYMGLKSISFIDFQNKLDITNSPITFFTFGKTNLPPSSKTGDILVKNKKYLFSFRIEKNIRILEAEMRKFTKNSDFRCYFELSEEPKESIVIATPFLKPKHFYYNQKIVGFKATGYVEINNQKIEFNSSNTRAILDWGRGVWTYKNTWYWSAACGMIDNKEFGFNFGYGFGNTERATENAIFYDGKLHKLDQVTFNIPKNAKGKEDYLKPWTITENNARLYLDFVPILDRKSLTNLLILCSNQHQVFGKFSGYIILDNKQKIEIKNLIGFAEKVFNKW